VVLYIVQSFIFNLHSTRQSSFNLSLLFLQMSSSIGIDTGRSSTGKSRELRFDNDTAADADGTGIYGEGSTQGVRSISGALAFSDQTYNNEPASHSIAKAILKILKSSGASKSRIAAMNTRLTQVSEFVSGVRTAADDGIPGNLYLQVRAPIDF
jgi:hypothetical protein